MRAHTTAGRTLTYLIAAAAVAAFVLGFAMIGWYADSVQPTGTGPTPTVTVTNPTETVTKTAPRRPRKYVTETVHGPTVTVPGPTVTVTKTVETPGPTVTVTATPDDTPIVSGAALAPMPMALSVDTAMSPGWKVERAARLWNRALGCEVFTLEPSGKRGQSIYWVSEVEPGSLMLNGEHVRALHSGDPVWTVEFDAKWGIESYIAVHELGHALGLSHNELPGSIMNVSDADRSVPSADDVATAKYFQRQMGRCQP